MKNSILFRFSSLLLTSLLASSCSVIGGIFKTGMGFGILGVIVVIVILILVFSRGGKKN